MADTHDLIVRRVVTALEETKDPDLLVEQYFEADRDAVVQATRQTLEATREDTSVERVEAAVDRELIEALRFPPAGTTGWINKALVHRGRAVSLALLVAAVVLALLL